MLTSRPTHGGGAPLGIDLEAGIAKITVRRPAPPADPEPEPAGPAVETAAVDADDASSEDPSPTS